MNQRQNIIDKQIRIVFKMKYAAKMQILGHKLLSIMPNPTNSKYDCWVFQYDQTFDSDLHQIIQEGRKNYV